VGEHISAAVTDLGRTQGSEHAVALMAITKQNNYEAGVLWPRIHQHNDPCIS
jgi:hypothetical protein